MSRPPRVSVVMGTYNGSRFIRTQLESLASQELIPLELVVCDDQSTDNTIEIIKEFSGSSPFPVKIHRNETRLGFADNFIKAALLAEGDFISFCDQDDVWYPEKLAQCLSQMVREEVLLCSHDADLCNADGKIIGYHSAGIKPGSYPRLGLNPWGSFFGFTCVVRRSLLQMMDPAKRPRDDRSLNDPMSHDNWIYFLSNCFGETVYIDKPLASYRQHGSNLYGSNDLSKLEKVKKLINQYSIYVSKYAALAKSRVNALNTMTDDTPFKREAISFWQNIANRYSERIAIAECSSLFRRTILVSRSAFQGTYRSISDGGIGKRAFIEDTVAAISQVFVKQHKKTVL